MALLRYITLNTTPGLTYVNYPPGIINSSIVCVKRTGVQFDKVELADINDGGVRQWCFSGTGIFSLGLRIRFPLSIPFNQGETVYVMYKPTI